MKEDGIGAEKGPGDAARARQPLRRLLTLPTLISLSAAGAFLLFLVTRFDVDLAATWRSIAGSDLRLYGLAVAVYYLSFILRGARWRVMASNVGVHRSPGGRLPSVAECALLILLGWFINAVGWMRMGDGYRAYAFAEASRGSFSQSLGIIVAERVIDVAAVFVLLVAAMAWLLLGQGAHPSALFLVVSLALAAVGGVLLLLMARFGGRWSRWLPQRLRGAYGQFHTGALGGFGRMPWLAALSIGGWLLEVARLYLVAKALGLSLAAPMALFVALVNAILTTVPVTPGGLGVVEPGVVGVLGLALSRQGAVSLAVLDRSISYASIVLLGGAAFAVRHLWQRTRSLRTRPARS